MKQRYTQTELEILAFDDTDVIVTSVQKRDPDESPQMPVSGASDYDQYSTF